MPDGSTLLIAPVLDRAVGQRSEQLVLVALAWSGRRATVRRRVGGEAVGDVPVVRLPSWNLQSAVANASAFSVFVPSVLRWISSENELPSSWVRRFMPGVRAR